MFLDLKSRKYELLRHAFFKTTSSYNLASSSTIPMEEPYKWSRRYTQELRQCSAETMEEHGEAMRLLAVEVDARQQMEGDDEGVVLGATTPDIRNATKERVRLVKEGPQERKANEVFAGGPYEAVE
jgi:hypothetical protein